jgi:transketolase
VAISTTLRYDDLPALLTLLTGDEKHDRSSHSTLDVLWVLYDRVLRIDPERADDPERDRFLLSKGHGPTAYYAVLAAKGFIPVESLAGFGAFDSALGYHPERVVAAGVEISSGSLGHGLPIAVGSALALDARGLAPETSRHGARPGSVLHEASPGVWPQPRVVCLVGDAELEEGSNWEAVQLAGRLGLGRLTTVVVDNHSSTYGWPGGVERRFELEGWSAVRVDGRDHDALEDALAVVAAQPRCVVAEIAR